MKELVFNIEFLSDIVLPASSNNEGKIDSLDFISGSTFLGMVAKEYDEFEDSFNVFHSGKVRFGDATILQNNEPTYKVPLCFFYEKLDKSKVVNQLHTPLTVLTQAKQFREGYMTKDFSLILVDYTYAQKSAYDRVKRRSKESFMYGYSAIKRGKRFQFVVKYDETISEKDLERIEKNLLGKKRLGKSKSSQYGEVLITLEEGETESIEDMTLQSEVVVYVKSRLALVDKDGNPTYDLKHLVTEELDKNQIDWSRTQLRTSTYNRYDGTRESRDTQRVVINSGSVIVLKGIDKKIIDELSGGVGVYLSEGFGEVLINPSFLMRELSELHEFKKRKNPNMAVAVAVEDEMVKFLFMKEEDKRERLSVANSVYDFIKENQNIYSKAMNAQWGTIRSLCSSSDDELIANAVRAYISEGVAKDKWQGKKSENLLEAIEKSRNPLAFTKLLSMEMPKLKEKSND